MTHLVAVTGKGGVGKTTVAAFLVRLLLENGIRPVLAVDADPNSSLAPLLGMPMGRTISDMREQVMKEKGAVTEIPKERILEMKLEECILEANGFDLLAMGRPEGAACYCYVNSLLRGALARLRANYRVAVVDNEAGMEHLSRMNTDSIDCMVLVSEPTVAAARAVSRITALADGLPVTVRRKVLVWNKVQSSGIPEAALKLVAAEPFDGTVILPVDEHVSQLVAEEQSALTARMPEPFTKLLDACVAGLQEIPVR